MRKLNLEGQKFGRLTVLHDIRNEKGRLLWKCLCECGQFNTVTANNLKSGDTKSCGCLQKELASKRFSLPMGEANLNNVFATYRCNARKRDLEFSLTKEQFKKLVQQKCFYCGIKPHTISNHIGNNGKFIYNGIDRVDNTEGYIIDNCVTCCSICNDWKRTRTQQEFLTRIKLIYDNLLGS